MSEIHVLDDGTIDKIAAGEVVERPSSVIKELVENAIDAGADKIEVEIAAGGTSFMRVSDNGKGMAPEDVKLAILRHATSKLSSVEDLTKIGTLGFRGEALPSIAAVSRFSITTRQKGKEFGTRLLVTGGKAGEAEEFGCNLGTSVKVEDLFFNVPARKKFLKTTTTESNKINEYIIKMAFSHPEIAVRFINNNKLAVNTPGSGSLSETIYSVYGKSVHDELLTIDYSQSEVSVHGFITRPAIIKSSRSWQTIIVNGRIITSRLISKAVDNAYQSLLPKSGYPLIIISLAVEPQLVDINVHPQKAEVKFADENRIFKAVYHAVLESISKDAATKKNNYAAPASYLEPSCAIALAPAEKKEQVQEKQEEEKKNIKPLESHLPVKKPLPPLPDKKSNQDFPSWLPPLKGEAIICDKPLEKKAQQPQLIETAPPPKKEELYATANLERLKGEQLAKIEDENDELSILRGQDLMPLGQIDLCYIIAQGRDGMYIIDQHAAHERILYDKLGRAREDVAAQPLLIHVIFDVEGEEAELLESHDDILRELGFYIEMAGPNQVRLTAMPADIPSEEAEKTFHDLIFSLQEMTRPTPQQIRHACLATAACRAAIKAGDKLTIAQMRLILEQLDAVRLPYTCPHGRPTAIKFSHNDLAKMFKRMK